MRRADIAMPIIAGPISTGIPNDLSLATQPDVQALTGRNRWNRAPDPRLHESARPA